MLCRQCHRHWVRPLFGSSKKGREVERTQVNIRHPGEFAVVVTHKMADAMNLGGESDGAIDEFELATLAARLSNLVARLDPNAIDLVASMGGMPYSRIEECFEMPRPAGKEGNRGQPTVAVPAT
jgi:hypothetical protein